MVGVLSSVLIGMKVKVGRKVVGIVESCGKRFEMEGFVIDEIKFDVVFDWKEL